MKLSYLNKTSIYSVNYDALWKYTQAFGMIYLKGNYDAGPIETVHLIRMEGMSQNFSLSACAHELLHRPRAVPWPAPSQSWPGAFKLPCGSELFEPLRYHGSDCLWSLFWLAGAGSSDGGGRRPHFLRSMENPLSAMKGAELGTVRWQKMS